MLEKISVESAIRKGQRNITYPSLLIMVTIQTIIVYFAIQNYITKWQIVLGVILSIALAWLYWSLTITKWRIWSLENVRNIHDLKQKAIQYKLIWSDGSIFEKTEFKTNLQILKLTTLNEKFNRKDIIEPFIDDLSIPKETIIYYSKIKNYIEMGIILIGVFGGFYSFTKPNGFFWGIGLILVCGYFAYLEFKEATNSKPQIKLNENGIVTRSTKFYSWNQIKNEKVTIDYFGQNVNFYLTYDYSGGTEKFLINELRIKHNYLQKLLKIYRGRNNNYR
jgi:hypothetical protein